MGLAAVADKRVGTYSRGMKQRLGLGEVLMKGAEVAILDEPTSGLDPEATFELLDMIRGMKADGTAVLISSHLLDRVQAVCDRVALFNGGKIVLEGTVPELAQRVLGGGYLYEVEAAGGDVARVLSAVPGAQKVTPNGRGFQVLAERDISGRARARGGGVGRGAAAARRHGAEPRHGLSPLFRGRVHGAA